MLSMVSALIPPEVGRILLLSVARGPKHPDGVPIDDELEQARETLGEAMKRAYNYGIPVEALLTIAPDPWAEIERVASLYRCEAIVLGMGETVDETFDKNVVRLTNALDTNIMFLKAPEGWQLPEYADVLVPTAGRSDHSKLRARIFGSFARKGARRVNFCTVVSPDIRPDKEQKLFNELHNIMLDEFPSGGKVEILRSSDIATALVQRAASADLLVLGMPRSADGAKIIGPLIQPVIEGTGVPVLMISGAR
jgi:nucleotide-binding universal stress UspA family protein